MPTEYLLPLENSPMNHTLVCVLFSQINDFKRLEETFQVAIETATKQQSSLA
jgi:hypothetical protein